MALTIGHYAQANVPSSKLPSRSAPQFVVGHFPIDMVQHHANRLRLYGTGWGPMVWKECELPEASLYDCPLPLLGCFGGPPSYLTTRVAILDMPGCSFRRTQQLPSGKHCRPRFWPPSRGGAGRPLAVQIFRVSADVDHKRTHHTSST